MLLLAGCGDSDSPEEQRATTPAQDAQRPADDAPERSPEREEPEEGNDSGTDPDRQERGAPEPDRGEQPERRDGSETPTPSPREPSDSPREAAEPPSGADRRVRARFIRRADAICRAARQAAAEIESRNRDQAEVVGDLAGIVGRTVRRLRALELPVSRRRTARAYISAQGRNARLLRALAAAIDQEDEERLEVVQRELAANGERAVRLARRFGFRVCGRT
jgi:hypothetical protein